MAHVSEAKKKEVQEFVQLAKEYPVVGIVNMQGLPTPQAQAMRAQLRDSVVIRMTKKTLARLILKEAEKDKPGIAKLEESLKGMPAFIFTRDNPFGLFKTLKKSKSSAPAKGGQEAPMDIVVPAGPTPFAPGPIIGELGALGIKTQIDAGKVAVKEDSVVAKEGDTISGDLAGILARMGIEPMEVGLDLVAVYEDGAIFKKDVLNVDEEEYQANMTTAHRWAFNLAMDAGIMTSETSEFMLINAQRDAIALAVSQAVESTEIIDQILLRAEAQASSIKSRMEV